MLDNAAVQSLQASGTGPSHTDTCFEPCGRHSGWFCVWTRPQMERQAEIWLQEHDFPVFLPRHQIRLANRQTKIEPLFQRYAFARSNPDGQWVPILSGRGISGIIRSPFGVPKAVPEKIMARLFGRCGDDGISKPDEIQQIKKDQAVKVLDGPFVDFIGKCVRVNEAKKRVWLLLEMLGAAREIEFRGEEVEPV